ncbi:ABC transporter ATP-binding protein [Pacificoceanicola onchidii]|uniref:ABC transporter ATP-binding protein n=1 Tax=Pacificoceanicola onchidii TaxID=2562685 RepID=UPI0010A6A03F|nr:ABC transporter ATP-binding protein [Pacificoceanicola onchidii]
MVSDIAPVLRTFGLKKSFSGQVAVDGVDIEVGRGDIVGFLGSNGAGKTTVLSMIAGLQFSDAGTIELFGDKDGAAKREIRARVGFLQEKPRIYPEMSARAYLSFFAELYGVARRRDRVEALLSMVKLTEAADRPLGTYSRGMQQRACLARTLLHDPEFLVLDEPTLGLDPVGLAEMRAIFQDLNTRGVTLLFSSHQLAEMEKICDRVILMQSGRIVAAGRPRALLPGGDGAASVSVELFEDASECRSRIAALPGVTRADLDSQGRLALSMTPPVQGELRDLRARVSRLLTSTGFTVLNITSGDASLEELFLQLTTKKNDIKG